MIPGTKVSVAVEPDRIVSGRVLIVADAWACVWLDEPIGGRRTVWRPLSQLEAIE